LLLRLQLSGMIFIKNVKHDLGHEFSRMDIADIVLTILKEDVPVLGGVNLREKLVIEPLVESLIASVGKVPLAPE
jgi:hypothetical protein